jgi:D-amino-acid oxidase
MTSTRPGVLVVGAGVIGLTTAITLAEAGHSVLVKTAEPPEDTTSAVAGALWGPWLVEPLDRVLPWAAHTLATLRELAHEPDTGVRIATGNEVTNTPHQPPRWAQLLYDRRPCHPGELPPDYQHGTRYSAPLVDMPIYLAYLTRRLHRAGGHLTIETVTTLDPGTHNVATIVNCTGAGARDLVPDPEVYPVRGHHVVTTNPGLTDFLEADTGDSSDFIAIYPHREHVLLGGTAEKDTWQRDHDPATARRILSRCCAIEKRLAEAEILGHRIGLRPTRPQIRLEPEQRAGGTIIHNYGHGGAGVSLAWGCAATSAELAE